MDDAARARKAAFLAAWNNPPDNQPGHQRCIVPDDEGDGWHWIQVELVTGNGAVRPLGTFTTQPL